MPRFDVTAARAEIDAGREPVEMVLGGKTYVFPAVMPAEVEIEQMALAREIQNLPDNAQAPDQTDRMMRACFGEHYDDILQNVGMMERVIGMGWLMSYWAEPYQDPNLISGLMERARQRQISRDGNSRSASSSTSAASKPTSSASTTSTSRERSSQNGSPGGGSSPSTQASAASR